MLPSPGISADRKWRQIECHWELSASLLIKESTIAVQNVPANYRGVSCSFDGGVAHATARQFPGHANWAVKFHSAHWSTALSKQKESLVYLTADAEEEINSLDASCYYIIGGLVDRNQHKRICLNRAEEYGIRAARLPLSNFLQLTGSKVRIMANNSVHVQTFLYSSIRAMVGNMHM